MTDDEIAGLVERLRKAVGDKGLINAAMDALLALQKERDEARNDLIMARAVGDGAGSLLLDVQRDCIKAVKERDEARAALRMVDGEAVRFTRHADPRQAQYAISGSAVMAVEAALGGGVSVEQKERS